MDVLDRLLGHDAWTTRLLLERCRELTSEELHRAFDIGHGSLYETLVHMIGNVGTWTDLMNGDAIVRDESAWVGLSVEAMIARHDSSAEKFAVLATRIRGQDLLDELWLDRLDDPPTSKTYGGAIAHVITHNMHHRAEVLHMLARLGVPDMIEGDLRSWEASLR
jgi:uncharacterized damage-inducible protein DinB